MKRLEKSKFIYWCLVHENFHRLLTVIKSPSKIESSSLCLASNGNSALYLTRVFAENSNENINVQKRSTHHQNNCQNILRALYGLWKNLTELKAQTGNAYRAQP